MTTSSMSWPVMSPRLHRLPCLEVPQQMSYLLAPIAERRNELLMTAEHQRSTAVTERREDDI